MKNKLTTLLAIGLLSISLAQAQNQWVTQSSGTSALLTSVFFVSADSGYVCSQAGNIYKTVNGGTNWNYIGTGPGSCLFFLNALKGFGGGDECLLKTVNGGISWDTAYKNPEVSWVGGLSFPNTTTGYGIAWSTNIGNYVIKTTNSGTTWDTIYKYSGMSLFTSVFFTNSQKGYVGMDDGTVLRTLNGGSTWTNAPVDAGNIVSISSITFPTPDTGFITTDISGVYRTIDGGDTWNHLSFSFPPALYACVFTDANHGFVGGGNGLNSMTLYRTNNGGNNWIQSATGVQTLNAMCFIDSLPGYTVGTNGTILKYTHATGIDENTTAESEVTIYPNPAKDKITVTITQENQQNQSQIAIYTLQGQLILQTALTNATNEIDISNLSLGVYFLKVVNDNNASVKKFVKE
ncbi:MAG: T9SS type A sorting domain-containing protein [Bacteroidota bacterium]